MLMTEKFNTSAPPPHIPRTRSAIAPLANNL